MKTPNAGTHEAQLVYCMKKIITHFRALLAIAMMLGVAFPTLAHDFEVDGIYYDYVNKTAKMVAVTYKGSSCSSFDNEYTGSVIIPSSVTYNGITYSVTWIGLYAFRDCTGLTSVTIPNSVTLICSFAFYNCTGLTEVTIPNSVTSIYSHVFAGCTGLKSMVVASGNSVYDSRDNCNAIIETTTNTLISGCKNSIIPNSVTEIGDGAFSGCTGLTEVTIPNSVTWIGSFAFAYCDGLTSVTIPNSVTSIDSNAFAYCDGLTSVTIPNSVTSIGDDAFKNCTGLTSVTIPNSVTEIGDWAFNGCSGLTEVTIGNSVTWIGDWAFHNCTGLTEVTIPNSVTSIGDDAFSGCSGLTSITIPNSVTSIGDDAFSGCSGLTSITIPNSVTSIGDRAFYNCSDLTSVVIGKSVKTIGYKAFDWATDLTKIISLNPTPPTCSNSFYSYNYTRATLYVPIDSYAKYFIDDEWGQFTNIKKIETLVSSIKLNNTTVELDKGSTASLSATVSPSNATIKKIIWKSSNPQVAKVDQSGKITALSAGTTTITVTAVDGSEVFASCDVVVKGVETKITLSQTEANLSVNEIMTLTYTVTPSNTPVEWSTSNPDVAYIKKNADNSVTVVGVADGEAIVTARATDGSGISASCKVIVGVGGVEGVEVDENSIEVSRYDIHGRRLNKPTRGINIVIYSDGTTRKEIIKE